MRFFALPPSRALVLAVWPPSRGVTYVTAVELLGEVSKQQLPHCIYFHFDPPGLFSTPPPLPTQQHPIIFHGIATNEMTHFEDDRVLKSTSSYVPTEHLSLLRVWCQRAAVGAGGGSGVGNYRRINFNKYGGWNLAAAFTEAVRKEMADKEKKLFGRCCLTVKCW